MLSFKSISLRRGNKLLIENASATFHRRQRIGLTGANGTGKSSLMSMILGELSLDAGEFSLQGGVSIAHVAQETPALDCSALEYTLDGDRELRALQQQLEQAETSNNAQAQASLHAELETIDGYTAESRAARLLHGLGFSQHQLALPVRDFSGGWRMRLNLAQALMCRSDLLLLDEPTNHLDMDAIVWLEAWLKSYAGTLLLISHDRDFLDGVCTHIAHIEQQQLSLYTGGYSEFEISRAEKLAQQQAAFEKQQREIQHIQSFVDRFKAKATKAKQAQSRIKTLERMERLAPAHIDSPFRFQFLAPAKPVQHLINLDQADLGYSDKTIISQARLSLTYGSCVGLLGPNGAGKSTLMKSLAQTQALLAGDYHVHPDCKIAYFAQHQLEQLFPEQSAIDHLAAIDEAKTEQELRDFLGGFGFHGDRVQEPVAPFSGGEKARLVLAMLTLQRPNLLLLDEPTNHLDLEMRHALNMALQDFPGAVVIISHDRHLLRSVCDELYVVHDGSLAQFKGDIDDYPQWLANQLAPEANSNKAVSDNTPNRKQQRQQEAQRRQQLKPFRDAVNKAEKQLDKLKQTRQDIETKLADEGLYTDNQRKPELNELLQQQGKLREQLENLEMEWLEASEALEDAESGL